MLYLCKRVLYVKLSDGYVCVARTYADAVWWSRVLAASAYQCVLLVPSTGCALPGGQSGENEASAQGEKNSIQSVDVN